MLIHLCVRTHGHTQTHTHTHKIMHMCARTHTHTCTHTHKYTIRGFAQSTTSSLPTPLLSNTIDSEAWSMQAVREPRLLQQCQQMITNTPTPTTPPPPPPHTHMYQHMYTHRLDSELCFIPPYSHCLVGLVVKASASKVADPEFRVLLALWGLFWVESYQ